MQASIVAYGDSLDTRIECLRSARRELSPGHGRVALGMPGSFGTLKLISEKQVTCLAGACRLAKTLLARISGPAVRRVYDILRIHDLIWPLHPRTSSEPTSLVSLPGAPHELRRKDGYRVLVSSIRSRKLSVNTTPEEDCEQFDSSSGWPGAVISTRSGAAVSK